MRKRTSSRQRADSILRLIRRHLKETPVAGQDARRYGAGLSACAVVVCSALALATLLLDGGTTSRRRAVAARELVSCACLDDEGNLRSRDFVKQATFHVCDVACDASRRFTSPVREADAIAIGYRKMRHARVEMCMLCRDAEEILPNISSRIEQLARYVRYLHVTFIENDSKDATKWALQSLVMELSTSSNIGFSIESHTLLAERESYGKRRFPSQRVYDSDAFKYQRAVRYDRMSILRNRCLLEAMKRPKADYLIVSDADEDLNTRYFQMDGIAHSFGLRHTQFDWRVVCANGVGLLKPHKLPRLRLHRNVSEPIPRPALDWVFWDSLAYRDKTYNISSWRIHQLRIHSIYDRPLDVESCFGGLAIYDIGSRPDWHRCSYASHMDNDCEHVSFNNCLRHLGWRVIFNPRMVVNYVRP